MRSFTEFSTNLKTIVPESSNEFEFEFDIRLCRFGGKDDHGLYQRELDDEIREINIKIKMKREEIEGYRPVMRTWELQCLQQQTNRSDSGPSGAASSLEYVCVVRFGILDLRLLSTSMAMRRRRGGENFFSALMMWAYRIRAFRKTILNEHGLK